MQARIMWQHSVTNTLVTTTAPSNMIGPRSIWTLHSQCPTCTWDFWPKGRETWLCPAVNWSKPERSCRRKTLLGSCFSAAGLGGKHSWSSAGHSSVPTEKHHEQRNRAAVGPPCGTATHLRSDVPTALPAEDQRPG